MTYDLICDCKFRGDLRRKRVALVQNLRTDGQNLRRQKATTLIRGPYTVSDHYLISRGNQCIIVLIV